MQPPNFGWTQERNPVAFPAVLIGGPPHSGKSVLTYSLTHTLRGCKIEHYVLRACPDGEGDWANQADQTYVRQIRQKGPWTDQWVDQIVRYIQHRHLPLLVDVGGLPAWDQERIFRACTHAVLLTKESEGQAAWQAIMARNGVPVIADLTSVQDGVSVLYQLNPPSGQLSGLERGAQAQGPLYDALVDTLLPLFALNNEALRKLYLSRSPAENAIDLARMALTLGVRQTEEGTRWAADDLPRLLASLPGGQTLGLYGRSPTWISGAVAVHCLPSPCYLFDVRLGWVDVPTLPLGESCATETLCLKIVEQSEFTRIEITLPEYHVDYGEMARFVAPQVDLTRGVVLDGRCPLWLYATLSRSYAGAAWVAVHVPQDQQALVVASRRAQHPIGSRL